MPSRAILIIISVLLLIGFLIGVLILYEMWPKIRHKPNRILNRILQTFKSFKSYLKWQGLVLLGFLALGGVFGGVTAWFGPSGRKFSTGGQLIEYRKLDPSSHTVYEEDQNLESYSHVTIFTRVIEPTNGHATVTIFRFRAGQTNGDISRINSVSSSWARLELENSYTSMRLAVEPSVQAGAATANQVDVLIYLSPK